MEYAPLVPYIEIPALVLVPTGALGGWQTQPLAIQPFGALVATAVYVGAFLTVRQSRRLGLDEKRMVSLITWVVGLGFVCGHVLNWVLYYPETIVEDPWVLLRFWEGLSSFGGFIGGSLGVIIWARRTREPVLPYADVIASAFPAAWVLGRSGCAAVHDHPGIRSEAWFAVQFPGGGRFDLGLYEMLLTVPLAVAFLWLRRRPRPWGFYLTVMVLYYAPIRFALDFLRVRDTRYGALTPAQWLSMGLIVLGVMLFFRTLREAGTPASTRVPGRGGARRRGTRQRQPADAAAGQDAPS